MSGGKDDHDTKATSVLSTSAQQVICLVVQIQMTAVLTVNLSLIICFSFSFICQVYDTNYLTATFENVTIYITSFLKDKISFIAMCFHCSYNKTLECVVMLGRRTSMFT